MLVLRRLAPPGAKLLSAWTRSFGLVEFAGHWPSLEKQQFESDMRVIQDFVTAEEEELLIREIEPHISRLPYESSHWDDAIHGYREVERKKWSPENRDVLNRVSTVAFDGQVMPFVHILDLAEAGVIKPHVDSTRFCGHTIAGISLLSDCVMRLKRVPEDPSTASHSADLLLPCRSLYIMSTLARYKFTHEILASEQSWFKERLVKRGRRVSVICRNEP
ncbi:alpha-ketoglutarate-dependent dioxygenase alkB homolog 7, mitochondrial isoform X1 [Drosophila eugracilis]|uniref:alpha-ketoglutarate-dependent dioxygenase alkB homolog 7, mitochondrial isoform X1 n=1 Tax=Drosophila eugracilis TaxID=29029 RepID=UPI0007E86E72|nr:alpha-ketoglutarate-dependent dioxygenase alkB homolog 7, mitochondrial isoform X1 [Drosophila eugracilis]